MRLLFVADGPRDKVTVPEIVKTILNTSVEVDFREWKRIQLSRGHGYHRRLRFALLEARDIGLDGVVATIDCDKAPPKDGLLKLRSAREEDRRKTQDTPIPIAIGEAIPHLEAWLIDDPKAVRDALQFPNDKAIPHVQKVNPKHALSDLINESIRSEDIMELLSEIAKRIDIGRCNHADKTGFEEFEREVRAELEPLVLTAL